MSGYVVKIVIEDTHPPVWRRIIIPEKISFANLHEIIQCAFGWDDMHLHDFTFPGNRISISESGEGVGKVLPEKTTAVEEFLSEFKWIRYTYDFGDDWRHKIIPEKEMPEYDKRYASIIKAKGDNFIEDSGGGWDDEEDTRFPFNMDEANSILEKMTFPVMKGTEKSKKAVYNLQIEEEFRKVATKFMKELKKVRQTSAADQQLSSMVKKVNAWKNFCLESEDWIPDNEDTETMPECEKVEEVTYEQMTLPFVEISEEEPEVTSKTPVFEGYFLEKTTTDKSSKDILHDLSLKELCDYCKYLRIPYDYSWNKKRLSAAVYEELSAHPEYYLYVFERREFAELLELYRKSLGHLEELPHMDTIIKAMSVGITSVIVHETDRGVTAHLSFAADAEKILQKLERSDWQKESKKIEDISRKLHFCLAAYGIIDMDSMYEIFCKSWAIKMNKKDFQRYVYWHLRFNEMCRTLDYAIDGKSYVVVKDIEVEDILKNLSYGANIDYREYTRAELESQEMGFNSLNPCWNKYADFLHYLIKTDEEMFDMLMKEAFISTLSGGTCTNLMEDLLDIYEPQTNMEWVELWAVCIYVSINTGLPMLRGYSREEYARRTGKNAFDIALIDEEVIVEHPDQGTQLYELPIDIQQKLYESVFTPDTAEKNIKQVLKEIGGDNEEIMFLLANNYMSAGQYAKAETVLKRLKRICTYEDFSIEELLKMAIERQKAAKNTSEIMGESHTDGFKQSFRRAEPKIGRNDPCPCGSGKKYKKCCGRNI